MVLSSDIGEGSLFGFAARIIRVCARNKDRVNDAFTMLRQGDGMALSPVSSTPSAAQLAVMEQIRALRAAKTATPVQATTRAQATAPVQAKPSTVSAPAQSLSAASAAAGPMAANRPRGSILNITV
jgi:hypothetical protein